MAIPILLQVYAPLLPRFPALTIFHNLSSPSPNTELYIPFSPSFVPLTLSPASLLGHIPSLFSSSPDQPMWTPSPPANFSGASPFIRHVQFWIAIHNQFQEEMQLPDPPFIFVSTIIPGEIPSLPSGYFHMKDHPPPPSLLYSTPARTSLYPTMSMILPLSIMASPWASPPNFILTSTWKLSLLIRFLTHEAHLIPPF